MKPNSADVRGFILRLIELTEKEALAEEKESSLLFSNCDYKLLELKQLALSGLIQSTGTTVGLGGKRLVTLARSPALHPDLPFPPNGFRPGDIVEIVSHTVSERGRNAVLKEKGKESCIEGVVYKSGESQIVVALRGGSNGIEVDEVELPQTMRLLKLSNPTTFTRQITVLRNLLRQLLPQPSTIDIIPPSPLISVLLGLSSPSIPPPNDQPLVFLDERLNDSQREAVKFVLRDTAEVGLIWGPPGTGKTQTLVEIIRQLIDQDQRILVCGASNLAVDNLVERLAAYRPSIPLTRIGHPARILDSLASYTLDSQSLRTNSSSVIIGIKDEIEGHMKVLNNGKMRGKERRTKWDEVKVLRKEFRAREGGVVREVLGRAKVVLATTHGAGNRMLKDESEFDVIIIDEAAQAVEPGCWIPIMRGKKLILAGDHLQLPPTIKTLDQRTEKPKVVAPKVPPQKERKHTKKKNKNLVDDIDSLEIDSTDDVAAPEPPSIIVDPSPVVPTPSPAKNSVDSSIQNSVDSTILIAPPAVLSPVILPSPESSLQPSLTLETTLFSRLLALHGPSIRRMLKIQYRSNSKIMAFASAALYDGELVADASVENRLLSDLESVEADEEIDEPLIFIDTAGAAMYERSGSESGTSLDTDSKSNENEAALVVAHVESLVAASIPPESITIISPYSAQVTLLSTLLSPSYPSIQISSIDGVQGRENDIIILSLVRSNPSRQVGFLSEKRRLNVAMTRARRQLCIVGDSETVRKGSEYLESWMRHLEEFAEVRGVQ